MISNQNGVCIVISDLCSGGAQKVASLIANKWIEKGIAVTVVTMKPPESDFFSLSQQVNRVVIGGIEQSSGLLSAISGNISRLKKIRQAIVEANHKHIISFVTSTNILTILATLRLDVKVIISERNHPAKQSHGRMWDYLRIKLYRYASVVTANSHQALEAMRAYVPESKLAYVPNPIEISTIQQNATREKSVLHVGKLIAQKAHDVLLKAWAQVVKDYPDWRLDLVGDGPLLDEMKALSVELGIEESTRWHGWCNDVERFYQSSSIFVLPSRFEGTPNALMEAMNYKMPCIVSDQTGGGLDFVEQDVSGVIVPADQPKELADAIKRLIGDESLQQKLKTAARERMQQCELDEVLHQWEQVVGLSSSPMEQS